MLGAFYAGSEFLLSVTRRSRSTGPSRDRYSLRILWSAICIGVTAAIVAAQKFRFATIHLPGQTWVGIVLFAVGILLRWYSIIHLGRFFTVDVSIAAEHKVIDSGPYRLIRHPSYSGALLAFVGFGLCLHNWVSLLALLIPIIAAFVWRIQVEERALKDVLTEDYGRYAARTKRLIPFVY